MLKNCKRYGEDKDLYQVWDRTTGGSAKVITEGTWRGRHFVIVAHHTGNPCAYLEVFKDEPITKDADLYEHYDGGLCNVNGGSTYFGKAYWDKNDDRTYVGWDYGHGNDYNEMTPEFGGHKWGIVEILMDIAAAQSELQCIFDNSYE